MRSLLLLLPVVLAGCSSLVTQHEILKQSRVEIAQRESWADNAILLVQHTPEDWEDWRLTWRVSAGDFDYSESPSARGVRVRPGTERILHFTRKGCLIGYSNPESTCLTQEGYVETAVMAPEK